MSGQMCQQCGLFPASGGGGLCFICFERTLKVQQKQVEGANAQIEMAEAQRQAAEAQEEERRRERRRQKAAMLNDLPNQVEALLTTATTDESVAAAVSGIAQVCGSIDERTWLFLAKATPLVAETTYVRLRALLVPRLPEWWRWRDRLGPSLLKAIANSVRYKQFSSIPLVTTGLAETLSATQSQLDVAVNQAEDVKQQLAASASGSSTATLKVGEAVKLYRDAEAEVGTPIDPKEVEAELKSFDGALGFALFAGIAFILSIVGVGSGEEGGKVFGACCGMTTLLLVGGGVFVLFRTLHLRSLSGTALKERVERAVLEKNNERREKLSKRKAELERAEAEQSRTLTAHKQLQDRLPGLEASVRLLQQRLRELPAEVMRTHTDPLLMPILQG